MINDYVSNFLVVVYNVYDLRVVISEISFRVILYDGFLRFVLIFDLGIDKVGNIFVVFVGDIRLEDMVVRIGRN